MKILLIEPHADDLLLSMHLHTERLVAQGNEVVMTTISNMPGPEWERSTGFYPGAGSSLSWKPYCWEVGADWFPTTEIMDIDLRVHRMSPYEVRKHPTPFVHTWNGFIGQFKSFFDLNVMAAVKYALDSVKPDVVYSPLGIWHPMHIGVRYCVEQLWQGQRVFYVDYPYVTNKYGQEILANAWRYHSQISVILGTKEEVDQKQKLMRTCYPSVANILRFSGPPMYSTPEELFVLRPDCAPLTYPL